MYHSHFNHHAFLFLFCEFFFVSLLAAASQSEERRLHQTVWSSSSGGGGLHVGHRFIFVVDVGSERRPSTGFVYKRVTVWLRCECFLFFYFDCETEGKGDNCSDLWVVSGFFLEGLRS